MANPEDFETAEELCERAGVDPDEKITQFVLLDFAATLVDAGWSSERVINALKTTSTDRLADALLEASGWPDIFETVAQEGL